MRLTAAAVIAVAVIAVAAFTLSGCIAYDVASTAVGAATTVVSTGVGVAGGAICTVACSSDDDKK